MSLNRIAALLLPLAVAAPAFAGSELPLAPFHALDLHGGGNVVIRHGSIQRVTLLAGNTQNSALTVKDGKLEIVGCTSWWSCPWGYELKVEIVTPGLDNIEVHGGGDLKSSGAFPGQDRLVVSVHGGGDVDLRSMPADNVSADVHGGGDLATTAVKSLSGAVYGGGDLTYYGDPAKLNVATHGGGDITHGS
ncbi:MAG TPA: DUF2807 domain-containing protein [Rhizomicrobium sp.]|jgi:hypothetical protein|nr:DUF2807 domain-containing protein [Rhizomicrobium sp.]